MLGWVHAIVRRVAGSDAQQHDAHNHATTQHNIPFEMGVLVVVLVGVGDDNNATYRG